MKSLRSVLQTRRVAAAYTLVELMAVTLGVAGMGVIMANVLRTNALLSGTNTGLNLSGYNSRFMLDQVNRSARYSLSQPTLISASGAPVLGSSASADGLIAKSYLGYPYVLRETGGTKNDIPATTKVFQLEYRSDSDTPITEPSVGDYMLLESVTRPELEITAVGTATTTGGVTKRQITFATAIGEVARPNYFRVSAILFRKEAYTFVATDATADPRFELRHYRQVTSSTNFSTSANYYVLAAGFRRYQAGNFFTNQTGTSNKNTLLKAIVYSATTSQFIERGKTASTFTAMPVQLKLWSIEE